MINRPVNIDQTNEWRYEIKMVCDQHQLPQVRAWVRMHPARLVTAYPARQINNVYLDTPQLNSFEANLIGASTRQKLRLRWYGPDVYRVSRPILELKYKDNMLGGKKRIVVEADLDMCRPWREILRALRASLAESEEAALFDHFLKGATQPTILNRYMRDYYVTADKSVRVTLDYDLVAYDQRLRPRPNFTRPLPGDGDMVIELKADQEHIEALHDVAGSFPLRRSRNSKYVKSVLSGGL